MQNHITNRQLYFILVIYIVGYTVIQLPQLAALYVGTGAWFSFLILGIIYTFPASAIIYLGNIFEGKTFFEYSKPLIGKFITYILTILFILYFSIEAVTMTRASAEIIKSDFLPRTPIWVIASIILITSSYAASKGINTIGRISEFYGLILLIQLVIMHSLMLLYGDFKNILPLFDISETTKYFKGMLPLRWTLIGSEVLLAVPMYKINGRKSLLSAIGAVLTSTAIYILIVESTYSILGLDDIVNYKDALVVAIRMIDVEFFQFLKRLDVLFIMGWLITIFSTMNILIYSTNEFVYKIIPNINKFKIISTMCVIMIIGSLIPKNFDISAQISTFFFNYIGIVLGVFLPLILLFIAKVKKYDKKIY